MRLRLNIFLITLSTLLCSCEGYRIAEGTVIQASTEQPLDSVKVNVLTGGNFMYTESDGKYSVRNPFGGCMFGCDDIIVEYSKEGYQPLELKNKESNGTIRLYQE